VPHFRPCTFSAHSATMQLKTCHLICTISCFIQWRTQKKLLVGENQVTGGIPRINFQNLELYLSNMNKHYSDSKIATLGSAPGFILLISPLIFFSHNLHIKVVNSQPMPSELVLIVWALVVIETTVDLANKMQQNNIIYFVNWGTHIGSVMPNYFFVSAIALVVPSIICNR
jgi:hypothetical protein